MKKIATITLNPAFDLHYSMEKLDLGRENYVKHSICDAAGKGINISRVLLALGVRNTAYLILGRENGAQFEKMLVDYGVDYRAFYTEGRVRENITLHPKNKAETRISLDDFSISKACLDEVVMSLEKELERGDLLAFSGRIPRGVLKEDVISSLVRLKSRGARLAVDCNSLSASDLQAITPWLIKPNEEEIFALAGKQISRIDEAADTAFSLVREGVAEQVMISLGGRGLAWSDGEKRAMVSVPEIENPISTVGAGDSTVAGYLAGCFWEKDPESSLALAAACGMAACLTEGTAPPDAEDVKARCRSVNVTLL